MSANPFRPAEQVAPKVKCLIYGQSGVGKTYLALTAPGKVAVIDTEGGTAFYAGRSGLSDFDVLPTKTFNDVQRAITFLASHPDLYETLVIDPVTVLYETLQDAAQLRRAGKRGNPDADLEMLDWQQIKRLYKALMTDLVNLPMHVIVTARERDDTERRGNDTIKIGVKPDAEKSTPYYFDTVLRMVVNGGERAATVDKDRTGTLPDRIVGPTFAKLFAKAIKAGKDATGTRHLPNDDDAAVRDSETTFADNVPLTAGPDGGLIGVVKAQGTQDYQLRQSPTGWTLPFRISEGRKSIIVVAHDELAVALAAIRETVMGVRVKVWGEFRGESFDKTVDGRKETVEYQILHLSRIETPDAILPSPTVEADPAEPTEAESVPMFDADEQAAIDEALAKVPA